MKILLLEDDSILNEAIKNTLESFGYKVDSFFDGEEALDNVSNKYDLYILDVNTPKLNGISVLKHIKKINLNSKVIMISANINIDQIRKAYENGCDDYVKKPFDIEEIILKIKRLDTSSYKKIELQKNIQFCTLHKELYIENTICDLTKNEKNFLTLLVENKGSKITYEQIEDFVYQGTSKSNNAIRSLVKRLRKKLPKDLIQNSMDEGYFIESL